jgi:glycosyltransferase involved in cell wall biosynthesis
MGVPVVASNVGGISEIVFDGETGYLVEPGNVSALADAISEVWVNQNNYQAMSEKARKLIVQDFDKATQFDRFISYFHTILNTG